MGNPSRASTLDHMECSGGGISNAVRNPRRLLRLLNERSVAGSRGLPEFERYLHCSVPMAPQFTPRKRIERRRLSGMMPPDFDLSCARYLCRSLDVKCVFC